MANPGIRRREICEAPSSISGLAESGKGISFDPPLP